MESSGRPDRKAVAIDCHVDGAAGHASLRLADLSPGGGFAAGPAQVVRGERIVVTFTLDGHELHCAARVAHVQPARGFGFAFLLDELSEPARLALDRLVDEEE